MKDLLKELELHCNAQILENIARALHSAYQPFLLDVQIWQIIEKVFPENLLEIVRPYKKTLLGHDLVNDLVLKYYPAEMQIKYHFAKKYLNRKNEIITFELNVNNSRLDIARINGISYAYEIKTELDTLDKLEKQIQDYALVFEYIYVLIHPKHLKGALSKIPDYVGVITYNLNETSCKFHFKRKASKNVDLDSKTQLQILTAKELEFFLKHTNASISMPASRLQKEEWILRHYDEKKINTLFKEVLKKRFDKKWSFLCDHFDQINPIDIQVFFKTSANPKWVYYKNSSIV
ncbi:sce7726 family protein [Anoxybacillus sp. FSL W8-0382]|uniref:sce7726 family protein n=1 Tax=Anoxybacillus sp. FSL W8-0382 TaxID=2954700 RepID=UPI0030F8DB62